MRLHRILLPAAGLAFLWYESGWTAPLWVLGLALVTWLIGLRLGSAAADGRKKAAKLWLLLGLAADLGLLLYFKFFKCGGLIAPLGLSYYTLSIAAYLIDVAHKKHPAEDNFADYLCFVTFFLSLLQGPINPYRKLMPQIKAPLGFRKEALGSGLRRILWGLFKKMVIADRLGIAVIAGLKDPAVGGFALFLIMVLYSFQIYSDFSGGIDVIMGIAEILGFFLPENFRAPFLAETVSDFWKRWHISLGDWMEKYLYYPLVLSKPMQRLTKKIKSKYFRSVFAASAASFAVFVVVGIWHGTGWNYVIYGLYQAFWVSGGILTSPARKKLRGKLHINDKCLPWRIFCILRTFVILVFGRYLSRAGSLQQAFSLYSRTFSPNAAGTLAETLGGLGLDRANLLLVPVLLILLLAAEIAAGRGLKREEVWARLAFPVRALILLAGIFGILVLGMYGPGYDAAAFIYQSF